MNKQPNNGFIMPLLLSVTMGIGLLMGNLLSSSSGLKSEGIGAEKYQKMQDIIQAIDQKYVDEVNGEKLFEKAIGDMLHQLDPHSNYIPASELKAMNESIEGKFGGIGVRFFILRDTICVTHVVPNSPSDYAGLKPGDRFIQINGKSVAKKQITNEKVMKLLKGDPNTKVNVVLLRKGNTIKKQLVRGIIPIESISANYMIDKQTGYIKIDQFSVNTYDEFMRSAMLLKKMGMKQMILDLRDNGGGVLTSATDICDEFLDGTQEIVKIKGKHKKAFYYRSKKGGLLTDIKLGILINSNSASASEIVAGAMQDNDRAVIVGRRSFGKGLVQEDVPLRDGSNLRLTIARYYTPTGRCIQKPYSGDYEDYYSDQVKRYDSGELYKPDTTKFADSLKFKTPKGKIVYGGGGIMPDAFVPYDTTGMTWYYTDLRYSSAFQGFAFDYVEKHRSKWGNRKMFMDKFIVDEKILQAFVKFAEEESSIPFIERDYKQSKLLIAKIIKAEIARQLFLEEGYFEVVNQLDIDVQTTLKKLK